MNKITSDSILYTIFSISRKELGINDIKNKYDEYITFNKNEYEAIINYLNSIILNKENKL